MYSPEERKAAKLKTLTSFLREEPFLSLSSDKIQAIEAAINTAYDAGKGSIDEILTNTLINVNYNIEHGGYGTYKKR